MSICVPVRDMKNTAAFTSLVENQREVTVTKNGYDVIHCMSNEEYQLLKDKVAEAELLSRIMLAEREFDDGDYEDYSSFASDIRNKYGL